MSETFDLILKGGSVVNQDGIGQRDVAVRDGRIADIGVFDASQSQQVIDVTGLHVLPGVIDSQVHFREPGGEHKEDLETGSRAAVMGGVTSVFEMPNTSPTTTNEAALADKVSRAQHRMYCDFAFYMGGTRENVAELAEFERLPGCCGIKVFAGSSTGNLLVEDDESLERILANINRRAAFHSEDEARLIARMDVRREDDPHSHTEWRDNEAALKCTKRLIHLARKTRAKVHILHISTAQEVAFLRDQKDVATVEMTPSHLTLFTPDAYDQLGTYAQLNPPIRDKQNQDRLWWGLNAGITDVLGSDHSPHTREEKDKPYPNSPSGMPGVQTLVPVMLDHVNAGRLTLQRLVDLTSHGPQRIFGIAGKGRIAAGYDADFTIVDMNKTRVIEDDWIESTCGWTPLAGKSVKGWVRGTIIRGHRVMWDDELIGTANGEALRFW